MGRLRILHSRWLRRVIAGACLCVATASAALAQPVATATATPPAETILGEPFTFTVTFDNTGSATGYGPFIDLLFPATGADGAGAETDDGITFVSATYLGQPVPATTVTLDANGRAAHPFAVDASGQPIVYTGTPGDQAVVLLLPFGSFTPDQPSAPVTITAATSNLADLEVPLSVGVRGGFQFGSDALANPDVDPSIIGAGTFVPVTPVLWTMSKVYLGPEDETTSGPNFPRQYRIEVDLADGQTVANLDLTDLLPDNLQFVSVDATSGPVTDIATPSTTVPGGTLTRRFASVTGTAADADASVTFTVYATGLDAGATPVLNPPTGDDTTAVDDVRSTATWTPVDTRDPAVPVTNDATANDHTLTIKSVATQKSVAVVNDTGATGPTPGDTLEYTIQVQVSDFFAFQGMVLNDIISDGQLPDPAFVPTLGIVEHSGGTSATAPMVMPSYSFTAQAAGTTTARFLIGLAQLQRGLDQQLLGGCVPPGGTGGPFPSCDTFNGGPTSLTLVYRTVIQDQFVNPPGPASPTVSDGDVLGNDVSVSADIRATSDLTPTGSNEDDDSSETVTVLSASFTKTVYAVNGSTTLPTPVHLGPGDTVTYRLRYTLPTSDVDGMIITDYLPLPVLLATEVTPPFDPTVSAAPPAAGQAKFGPADTWFGLTGAAPTITTDGAGNSVAFAIGAFSNPANTASEIDILFTVTTTNAPFADGLVLSNFAEVRELTTNGEIVTAQDIGQITLNEPSVVLTKGVVATDSPTGAFTPPTVGPVAFTPPGSAGTRFVGTIGSTGLSTAPVDSNLSGVDAEDLVTYAIVVENVGSGPEGAFDIDIRDTFPALMQVPAGGLNLTVTSGAGTPLPFTDLGGGIFGSGIRLNDPGPMQGALTSFDPAIGTNIAVITYDLQLIPTAVSDQQIDNTATVGNYAGVEGGPDFTAVDIVDMATVRTTATVALAKTLVATSQSFTPTNNVAIGELVSVQVTLVVPQGVTEPLTFTDTLDPGLALVSLDSITASPALTASGGAFPDILAAATIENVGGGAENNARRFILDFGAITNTDPDPGTMETIVIAYTGVVLNTPGNNRGVQRSNSAVIDYTNGSSAVATNDLTILEPTLQVVKTVDPTVADQGDTVRFTLTVTHDPASNTDAFEVALADVLPAGLTLVSAAHVSGLVPATFDPVTLTATWPSFPRSSSSVFQIVATIDAGAASGLALTNTGTVTYTGLPGVVTAPQSTLNGFSVERTGNPADIGGAENDYAATGTATVRVRNAGLTKMVVATNQIHTSGNAVAIGEIVTYELAVDIPEAVSNNVTLVDTLDPGLAFVDLESFTVSNPAMVTISGSTTPVVTSNGQVATFNLGTVTNANAINGIRETITIRYRAVSLNVPTNVSAVTLSNEAVWTSDAGAVQASANPLVIVEPVLQVTKTAAPAAVDAGDTVLFTIQVQHAPSSTADALDAALADPLPAGLTLASGPTATGVAPTTLTFAGGILNATWAQLPIGGVTTITFTATVDTTVLPGAVLTNTASLQWTSLPGAVQTPQSAFNPLSVERTGNPADPGGAANTYATSGVATVTLNTNSLAGVVYIDSNGDGTFTAGEEIGVPPTTITLTGTDHLGNPVSLQVVAASPYAFTNLRPGTYTVSEAQPFGLADGPDQAGSAGGTAGNDVISAISLPTGVSTSATGYNFGELPTADLQVVKTDVPDPVLPGGTFTYTMVVTNNGPSDAVNVTFRDPVPAGTTFVSLTADPSLTCTTPPVGATGDVVCTTPLLPVGASVTVAMTLMADAGLVVGAVITNAAAAGSDTIDLRPDNNHDDEPTHVAGLISSDLAITKTDAVDPVVAGDNIVYTLTVMNNGPAPATGVTVTDTLPAGVTLVSATPGQGTCSAANPVVCDLGALAASAQATIAVTVGTATPGLVVNTAVVTATEPDPAPANNGAAEPTTIVAPGGTDLAITKEDSADPVSPGAVVVYRVTITNRGPNPATGVTLNDPIPAGTTFEYLTAPAGFICTTPAVGATGSIDCTGGSLAVGASATFDIGVRLDAGVPAGATINNTATTTSNEPDSNPANNTDTEPTLVVDAGAADVEILKTDAPDAQAAGAPVSYTFTVVNHGLATATNVTVSDTLPPGTAFLGGSPECTAAGTVVTCTIASLPPGASTAVGVTISTPPSPQVIVNTVTVTASEPDLVPANNTDVEPTTLVAVANVRVAKTGPPTATPGANVVYSIVVVNDGPSIAENVTVADPTPAGLTFVSNADACTTAFPCLLGAMAPGEARTITTTFAIPPGYTAPNPIVNIATVSTTTPGDQIVDNVSQATTPLAFSADIAVTKEASRPFPGVGGQFDYIISAMNLGPSDATNVIVTDTLPPGVTYVSHVASSGTFDPGTGLWTIPALTAGGPAATLTITVTADQIGPLPNTATRSGGDQPDPNPANDTDTVIPIAVDRTDIAIAKTGPARVLAGGQVVYTLTIVNNGPSVAVDTVVDDPTPANLVFVSNAGNCTTAFPCSLGNLDPGASRTITSTYTVGVVPNGTLITNVATVATLTPELVLDNNTASADTIVHDLADVGVQKSVTPRQVRIGELATFEVRATNHGPNPATEVVIHDKLPEGLIFQSATASQGIYIPLTGRWEIGDLAVGQTETLTLVGRMTVADSLTNVAVKTDQVEPDPNRSNDSAAAVINPDARFLRYADVGVAKTADEVAIQGAPITFTIVTTNYGPDTAPAVVVDDVLPPAVTFVSATASQGTYDGATGRWTIGEMLNGASQTLSIVATVNRPGPFVNLTRVVNVGAFDPNPFNDRDAIVRNSGQAVNVRVTKTALRPTLTVTQNVPFLITITNDGPSPATGVQVADQLPPGLIYVASFASQGTYDPATAIWDVGSLDPTQTAALVIVAQAAGAGTALNTATVAAITQEDLNPNDNADSALVSSPATTGGTCTDVELRQEYPSSTTVGGQVSYRYTAVNRGPAYAEDVAIWGFVPPGTSVVSMTPSPGGTCTIENGNEAWCRWPGLTLVGEGAARQMEIVVQVDPTPPSVSTPALVAGDAVWAWWMVSTSSPDCNPANGMLDSYVYVTNGGPTADLQLQAAVLLPTGPASRASVPVGAPIDIWFAVTNHGAVPASGDYKLKLSEEGAITVDEMSSTGGSFHGGGPGTADWITGPIAPGTTIYAHARARMNRATAVAITALKLRGSPADSDATNDIAELAIDGVGPAPSGGRWVAAGNVDGIAGDEIVTGTVVGERPQVQVFTGSGAETGLRFWAFEPTFLGGVRVAACDINGDGADEIVMGQGTGGSLIRVMRVVGGAVVEVTGFHPFEPAFAGGVSLACADIDGDLRDDIVVGAGPGRSADVRTFTVGNAGPVAHASWTAYPPPFAGGVRVAAGRHPGSALVGPFEVATAPGEGLPTFVGAWQVAGGTGLLAGSAPVLPLSYRGGATLTMADLNGDGVLDLAVTPDNAAAGLLRVFSLDSGALFLDVPAGTAGFTAGIRTAAGVLTGGPGSTELVVSGGAGGQPLVHVFTLSPAVTRRVVFWSYEYP